MYTSRRPAAPLDAFIETLWTSERPGGLPHAREWNLPSGCADLVVPLTQDHLHRYKGLADPTGDHHAGGLLQGPQQQPTLRDTAGALAVVGAHFRPGGLAAFFEAPTDAFTDQHVTLDDIWPGFGPRLREQLQGARGLAAPAQRLAALEAALSCRLRPRPLPALSDPMVQWALRRLAAGPVAVGQVQRESGCSAAHFIARYKAACGLTPKRHAALMRFNSVLQRSPQAKGWAMAAADAGYADQAHLVREFRRFAGFTPGHYLRHATAFPQHVASG